MTNKFKCLQKIALGTFSALAFLGIFFCKMTPILGSKFSFFSLSGVLTPMIGLFGMPYVLLVLGSVFGSKLLVSGFFHSIAAYHIPTLCASYYVASRSRIIAIGLPLVCMIAFLAHPVGYQAAPYVLYWFIPIFLTLFNITSIVGFSLTTTFIAHAVGSVIWLYTKPMSSAEWLSLLPVVFVERCCFAGLMILVYYAGISMRNVITSLKIDFEKIKGFVG
jgi:hypothetical protein